jgi:hypothetical protein
MKQITHAAFTICSNNYLGQALALKRSLLKHNPSFSFFIILVDKLSNEVDYSLFDPAEVIPIPEVDTIDLDDLIARYYIIELNTAVKPSVFKFLKTKHSALEALYYLDPDLYFYDSLEETNSILQKNTAVLTPHILSPIPRDGKLPEENTFLQFGIYNLGFAGINMQSDIALGMLDWWEERVIKYGYDRPQKGYFVDQLWMAQAPLFFKNIVVLKTYNYNMAPWNLHERRIESIHGDRVMLNDGSRLVFYHFSKLAEDETAVSREYNRYRLDEFPLLKELYTGYKQVLRDCHFTEYKSIPIAFDVKMNLKPEPKTYSVIGKLLRKIGWKFVRMSEKV